MSVLIRNGLVRVTGTKCATQPVTRTKASDSFDRQTRDASAQVRQSAERSLGQSTAVLTGRSSFERGSVEQTGRRTGEEVRVSVAQTRGQTTQEVRTSEEVARRYSEQVVRRNAEQRTNSNRRPPVRVRSRLER